MTDRALTSDERQAWIHKLLAIKKDCENRLFGTGYRVYKPDPNESYEAYKNAKKWHEECVGNFLKYLEKDLRSLGYE